MKMTIVVPRHTGRPLEPLDVIGGLLENMDIDLNKVADTLIEVEKSNAAKALCWVVPAITLLSLPVRFTHNPEVKGLCLEVEVK